MPTLKRSKKSVGVHEQMRLQPPKDSRPVSSMSSTGSATSRDSGCSFGEQISPVNFTCGDTNTSSETPPLAEECTIADFLPLSPSTIQSFLSASGAVFDVSSSSNRNTASYDQNSVGQQLAENPLLQMHHHRAQAKQQGILTNSNSSPCLYGMASAAAIVAAAAASQKQITQKQVVNKGDDSPTLPSSLPLGTAMSYKSAAQTPVQSTAGSNKTMSATTSFSDLTQYINPEIHNVRAPIAASQDTNTTPCTVKGNRQDAYKTVMCQAWLESTKCSFGENCKFAHGEGELRPARIQPRNNTKYKTKLCDKYTNTGICPYGSRCLFIHPPTKASARATQAVPASSAHPAADNSLSNASALLNSAMLLDKLQNNLTCLEGSQKLQSQMSQQDQLELLRKLLAVTPNQNQGNSNASMSTNFPPLPNSYSMPSVFSSVGGEQQGSRVGQLSSLQRDKLSEMPSMDRPSVWSQATVGSGNSQKVGSQEGLLTLNGGRPHPSWPLESPKFFNDLRRSSCIEQSLTAPVSGDTLADKEHQIASRQIKDRFGYQTQNFGARFHHQSMPLFNLPANLQQHLPNSRKSSKTSSGEPSAIEDLEEYLVLPAPAAPTQRSSTQTTIPASNTPSPSNLRPLKKRFSNGVLHSVTPHSHYSSQPSCNSCSTSCLGGTVGRDILAEIWSSSVDSSPDEEEEFLAFGESSQTSLEIPPCLANDGQMANLFCGKSRHLLERDMTLTENDSVKSTDKSGPIDELSRQMEMQKLEDFLIATSENSTQPQCLLEALEDNTSSNFENIVRGDSPVNMVFQEFTDFDEIPALN